MLEIFNNPTRCQCKNANLLVCRNKQKIFLNINKKRTCTYHVNHIYLRIIIKIQKIYRGYKSRKKLNYFYKRLPNDIQDLIKYYINQELYHKRKENKIKIIVNRKLNIFNIEMLNVFNTNVLFIDEFLKYENKILSHFNLLNKYNSLVFDSSKKLYNNLDHTIISYIKIIQYYNDYNTSNESEIEFKKIRLDIIVGMLNYYYNIRNGVSSEC